MTNQQSEVLEAAAKIVADFGSHNKAAYFSNFSESATFIFHTHNLRLNSRAEYEKLWDSWEKEDGFRVHGCISSNQMVQVFGDTFAVFSHDVESSVEFAGETSTVFEKETIIFEKQATGWVAVHEHLSATSGS
jgi:ketosteroid isomerase-like protein